MATTAMTLPMPSSFDVYLSTLTPVEKRDPDIILNKIETWSKAHPDPKREKNKLVGSVATNSEDKKKKKDKTPGKSKDAPATETPPE